MINQQIKELENAVEEKRKEEWNYVTRVALQNYYQHLADLYNEYNQNRM